MIKCSLIELECGIETQTQAVWSTKCRIQLQVDRPLDELERGDLDLHLNQAVNACRRVVSQLVTAGNRNSGDGLSVPVRHQHLREGKQVEPTGTGAINESSNDSDDVAFVNSAKPVEYAERTVHLPNIDAEFRQPAVSTAVRMATSAQIQAIVGMSQRMRLPLDAILQTQYRANSLEQLTIRQASQLICHLRNISSGKPMESPAV